MDKQRIAELFIRCQQYKDRAWKAYIAKKDAQAVEHIKALNVAVDELERLLEQ